MEKYQNKQQDLRLSKIEEHIGVINSEMNEVKVEVATIREKVEWLCKTYWIVITASVSGLIASIINLLK